MANEINLMSETATAPASTGRIPWQNTDGTYGSATPAQIVTVGGGAGSAPAWGDITGTLSDQTDLQSALDAKVDEGAATASGLTMTTARLLGRTTASTGAIEEISVGSGLSLTTGTLDAGANTVTASGTLTSGNVLLGSGSKAAEASTISGTALLVKTATVTTVSGTSYEVTATDNGKILYFTSVSGCEVTLDADATVGVNVMLIPAAAAGDIDIVQDSGTTILNPAGTALTITGEGSASAVVVANDTSGEAVWSVGGDVGATA